MAARLAGLGEAESEHAVAVEGQDGLEERQRRLAQEHQGEHAAEAADQPSPRSAAPRESAGRGALRLP